MSELEMTDVDGLISDLTPQEQTAETVEPTTEVENPESEETSGTSEVENPEVEEPKGYYTEEERKTKAANAAFQNMRNENKAMQTVLSYLAQKMNLDTSGLSAKDSLQLSQLVASALSGEANTPVRAPQSQDKPAEIPQEFQTRLQQLELENKRLLTENAGTRNEQVRLVVAQGLENVKQEFGLTQEDLEVFADQLAADNKNPYHNPGINLIEQFKIYNFDKLAADKAEALAKERFDKWKEEEQRSTSPNYVSGGTPPANGDVKTVDDLDKLLDRLAPPT